jgi:hypothetical protein
MKRYLTPRRTPIWYLALAGAALCLTLGALQLVNAGGSRARAHIWTPGAGFIGPRRDGDPFLRGQRVTQAEVASAIVRLRVRARGSGSKSALDATEAGLYFYQPSDSLASPSVPSKTWMQTSQTDGGTLTQIATTYSTGVTIMVSNSQGIDYNQFVSAFEGQAQLVTIHGVTGIVVPENTDNAHQNMAIADLTIGDTRVVVLGYFPLSDIERVANSLQ